MVTAQDVAEAILERKGPMDTFRLHKLVYYAQALHLATTGGPLFSDRIEAWTNGPVVPTLYQRHRGDYTVRTVSGRSARLDDSALRSVETMLDYYGDQSSGWLVNQVHLEEPWRRARAGVGPRERSDREIPVASIRSYYEPVLADPEVASALAQARKGGGLTAPEIRQRYAV
ncbi:MAG: DUF4065 domain-containing protein [Actinomycetota bacterium]|nr:DUF4065 domain-containing protein [Actinomycetota bacterium]